MVRGSRSRENYWPQLYHLPRDRRKTAHRARRDRKSTRLNSSHGYISYAVFCLKKKKTNPLTATLYASSEFGTQNVADKADVLELDTALTRLRRRIELHLSIRVLNLPRPITAC